ncbi:MAG: hypothetical protein ACJAZ9_001185 [Neolewinella sp.]|jgi:hypothetical protein
MTLFNTEEEDRHAFIIKELSPNYLVQAIKEIDYFPKG